MNSCELATQEQSFGTDAFSVGESAEIDAKLPDVRVGETATCARQETPAQPRRRLVSSIERPSVDCYRPYKPVISALAIVCP
jgi:hypothetical protein